ncbi:MAG: hypothetical protein Q8N99_05940 [Nanoarchaeota archaeon]|nr:hypothetical protein [Nanoarchaeota archaeon]
MAKNEESAGIFKKTMASLLVITGVFVVLIISNSITGRVVGEGESGTGLQDLFIIFWAGLLVAAGIWIWRHDNFHKSIFKEK